MHFTFDVDLPAQWAPEVRTAYKLSAVVDATFHAEAISIKPLASKYTGTLSVVLTDQALQKTLASHTARIEGSGEGSPLSQSGHIFDLYFAGWRAVAQQLQRQPTPTTKPASTTQAATEIRVNMTSSQIDFRP
jgi:hypothetical protein